MTKGFWEKLPKPIFALAPMYDVTDASFRRVIAKYGKPDVMWTEFVSTDGLSNSIGFERLKHHLIYSEAERPIVAQIFGAHPQNYTKTALLLSEMKFDGIDINMGCPDKAVMKQGSCAALYKNPTLAKEIILSTKAGAGNLPVSVKIRIGDGKIDWQNWILALLEVEPAAITIHLRTRKEMSKVPAHWELMPEIVKFIHTNTTAENRPIILGNGDVTTIAEAKDKITNTGCDGVMIGRGVFGNPWLFEHNKREISLEERLRVAIDHTKLFEELLGKEKPFEIMKKHFKAYINGFPGAAELREKLYTTHTSNEVKIIIEEFLLPTKIKE